MFMRHLEPLARVNTPEVVYALLFIQGLATTLLTQVESKLKHHLGAQIMPCVIQMRLLEEAVSVAEAVNLALGVIAKVVHLMPLLSLIGTSSG